MGLQNYRIPVIDHGNFKFQFIHCNDLVDFSIIAENITGYNIFNVGTDQICTIKELMEGLIKHSKSKSKILFLPKITYQLINFLSYLKLSPINTCILLHYLKLNFMILPKLLMKLTGNLSLIIFQQLMKVTTIILKIENIL